MSQYLGFHKEGAYLYHEFDFHNISKWNMLIPVSFLLKQVYDILVGVQYIWNKESLIEIRTTRIILYYNK